MQRILIVSLCLETANFTLVGNDDIWSCHSDFMPKCQQKWYFLVFLDILGRSTPSFKMVVPASTLLFQGQCFPFPSPKLRWFKRYDFQKNRKSISVFLAGPGRAPIQSEIWCNTQNYRTTLAGNKITV